MSADHLGLCDAYGRVTQRRQAVLQRSDSEMKGVPDLQAHVHELLDCCRKLHKRKTDVVRRQDPDEKCPAMTRT
eukprot:jgi/Botrbrau1/17236/Bobra.0865s0003.1